jgi:MerR family transcriptional regulator, heat shock protein HspR
MARREEQRDRGVFAISVAAEMVSMQIQNLRVYERRGLVDPDRTPGGTRLYSRHDIDRLHRIRDLLAEGLNLAGVGRVLALEEEVRRLRAANVRLRASGGAAPERSAEQPDGRRG